MIESREKNSPEPVSGWRDLFYVLGFEEICTEDNTKSHNDSERI